jgi:Cupin domain
MDLAESKIVRRAVYQPGASSIEGLPTALEMFHAHPPVMLMPHWHVQVEVNYIMQGSVHYRMNGQKISMKAGDMCLFWGGQPHQMDDCSEDAMYAGGHLPLVYFFRMRLPINISSRLMKGEILFTSATDTADFENFPRWVRYTKSGDPAKSQHAVEEMLLRLERIALEPYSMLPTFGPTDADDIEQCYPQSSRSVARMCDFIAVNFLQEIDRSRRRPSSEIRDESVQEDDRHDAQQICQSAASVARAGDADERRGKRPAGRDGQRVWLNQRL